MSESAKETSIEEIARALAIRKDRGQRTVLFLGSRTGGLFGNEYLYETLKKFSLLNFDTLSNADKFRECYYVLGKRFTEKERHNILVGALAALIHREEDKLLAELVKAGLFEIIISTNIDTLLEDAHISLGLREPDNYRIFIPERGDITEIEQNKPRYSAIIKIFGDLESRHYHTAGKAFDLQAIEGLQEFLQSKLSKDVLMIGYDPVWDQVVEQAFPLTGGTIWYANETELPQHTYLGFVLQQRNGQLFQKGMGSYSNFTRALYDSLGEEIHRNEVTTALLPPLLQASAKDKKKVFISYSHKDKKYLERLTTHLKGYLHQLKDTVDIWDDTKILSGTDWMEEIKEALTQAKVAVLLVSANYLSSKFIKTYELPLLLKAADSGNVSLLPIILDPSLSLFSNHEPLFRYQKLNSSSKPLGWMNPYEQEVVWNKLAEQVYSILYS